jgi:DNA-binding HxlR family transcriptional regulator
VGQRNQYQQQDCSLARALEVVGERWTLLIVRDLFYGVEHFGDLQSHLDVPSAVLASRLQKLVRLGVVWRDSSGGGPTYALTGTGLDLWPAIYALAQWGERQFAPAAARRVMSHATCGTDLLRSGWCARCEEVPGPADITIRNGPGADPTLRNDRVSVALRAGPHRLLTPLFSRAGGHA